MAKERTCKWQKKEPINGSLILDLKYLLQSSVYCRSLHGSNCCFRVKWGVISINNQGKGLDFL